MQMSKMKWVLGLTVITLFGTLSVQAKPRVPGKTCERDIIEFVEDRLPTTPYEGDNLYTMQKFQAVKAAAESGRLKGDALRVVALTLLLKGDMGVALAVADSTEKCLYTLDDFYQVYEHLKESPIWAQSTMKRIGNGELTLDGVLSHPPMDTPDPLPEY